MSDYFYLDVEIKLAEEPNQLSALYLKGSIERSLTKVFGEIGGQTEVDLLKFDAQRKRIILRVPKEFYVKLRAAITLIGEFQGVPCNFQDKVIFATAEDHATPSKVELPESEPRPGLILENGDINWNCPCLGGMAIGPCGNEFREAFSCFHYSQAQPKGSDCYEAFSTMNECMRNYPGVYKQNLNEDEDEESGAGVASMIADEGEEEDDVDAPPPAKAESESKTVATKAN
uniref:CHCH domain-containing protein n=1 Tax=Anopheles quadriannulatus TaxID=34691 RepID=A0A182XHE8_ANOQN